MAERTTARQAYMDGLRGWASLSVAAFHFSWETFGARFDIFRNFGTALFLDGRLAVAVFFVISGYVLTHDAWCQRDKTQVRHRLLKRYTRLTIPVLACCVLVLVLMSAGLTFNRLAGPVVQRQDWLGEFIGFPADPLDMLRYAFAGVYGDVFGIERGNDFNPFLWTMTYEFWGSLAILVICWWERWLLGGYLPLVIVMLAIALVPYHPMALSLPLGALIARAHKGGFFIRSWNSLAADIIGLTLIAGGLVAGAFLQMEGYVELEGSTPLALCGIAGVIVVGVITSRSARAFLSNPLSKALGTLSFPIYLAQFPVLISVTSLLIILAELAGLLTVWMALGIGLISMALTIVVARCVFLPVEHFTAFVGRQLSRGAQALWLVVVPVSRASATAPRGPAANR